MNYEGLIGQSPRVLIAEGKKDNRTILEKIIEDMGYEAISTEKGDTVLALLKEVKPELLLLSVELPEMKNYELCKALKAAGEDVPYIFISSEEKVEDITEGLNLGGRDYITAPFVEELVQARLSVHLKLQEANIKLLETNRRLQASVREQLKQMELEKRNVLYALANAAAENAYFGSSYIERLQCNCRLLAQSLQLSPAFEDKISDCYVDTIEMAAPLCDVGNISIPIDILQKKSGLTEDEAMVVQSHTSIGAKLLNDINAASGGNEFIKMAVDIAKFHHEKWDGSGYPEGRKGEEIPLAAQIVSLVSMFCALTEKRSYRKACSRDEALLIMSEEANRRFNPDIFEIYRKIARQLC